MTAYRAPGQASPIAPSVFEYVSKLVRYRAYPLGFLFFLLGAGMLASIHWTKIECSRASGYCEVNSYGTIVFDRSVAVPIEDIEELHVDIRSGSKGGKYAVGFLKTRTHGDIDVAGGAFIGHFDVDSAQQARSSLASFLIREDMPEMEATIAQGTWAVVMTILFGIGMSWLCFAMMREQLRQYRKIRIVIDHNRHLLLIGGREVAVQDIAQVGIQEGRALFWVSGKNEHIPGWRLHVSTRSIGEFIAATKDYRAGPRAEHERVMRAIQTTLRDVEGVRLG